jgi:hypothetical protein
VVRVIDFLEANGTAYMVMALARGHALDQKLRDGPIDAACAERLLFPLLDGLEQVHNAGFLHRDIKPSNIIVDENYTPTLIDFGAARIALAGASMSLTAVFTPGYAAAEQFTSAKQGPWTDIYGLSATLYHAISGARAPSAMDRVFKDDWRPLVELRPAGFRRELLAAIDAGMGIRQKNRPHDIAEWRAMLSAASGTMFASRAAEPSAAVREDKSGSPAFASRWRSIRGLGVAAVLVALGGGYYFLADRVPFTRPAQNLTVEQLEQALADRRKADLLAEEKRRLEEEATRKAAADAEAKRQADADLEKARRQRQQAEEELTRLKVEIEARQKKEAEDRAEAVAAVRRAEDEAQAQRKAEADIAALRQAAADAEKRTAAEAEAKQLVDQEAKRKIEAEAAALRLAEEDAQKKAAAEEAAKRQADEALARARAERTKAEAEAKAKAEAEARAQAEADTKTKAEAAEAALRLSPLERQRLQVALTSLGFDTQGTDGAFGPRSRAMIAAWQKSRNQSPTGFLIAAERQTLLNDATAAVRKYDEEQKKVEDDKKKAEEEARKKVEDEAKKKAEDDARMSAPASPPSVPSPAPVAGAAPSASPAPTVANGRYSGAFNWPQRPATNGQYSVCRVALEAINGRFSGKAFFQAAAGGETRSFPIALEVTPGGDASGTWIIEGSRIGVRGRFDDRAIRLDLTGLRLPVSFALARVAP